MPACASSHGACKSWHAVIAGFRSFAVQGPACAHSIDGSTDFEHRRSSTALAKQQQQLHRVCMQPCTERPTQDSACCGHLPDTHLACLRPGHGDMPAPCGDMGSRRLRTLTSLCSLQQDCLYKHCSLPLSGSRCVVFFPSLCNNRVAVACSQAQERAQAARPPARQ